MAPDVIAAFAPAINGRAGTDPLFMRPRWVRSDGPIAWERSDERVPWRGVSDLRRPWLAIVERAGLPATVTPYALRHCSICRAMRAMLPMQMVARLHDTSAAMIEANYFVRS